MLPSFQSFLSICRQVILFPKCHYVQYLFPICHQVTVQLVILSAKLGRGKKINSGILEKANNSVAYFFMESIVLELL